MPLSFSSRFSFLLRFDDGGVLGTSSDVHRKSRLSLRLWERVLLGNFRYAFIGCVRFVWPFLCVIQRDLLPHLGVLLVLWLWSRRLC
jgi:hypothetical protein